MVQDSRAESAAALAEVQAIFAEHMPTARCELQDYDHRIGCGDMDAWGNIQDVSFVWKGMRDTDIEHHAEVLATKLRTGGSTAG